MEATCATTNRNGHSWLDFKRHGTVENFDKLCLVLQLIFTLGFSLHPLTLHLSGLKARTMQIWGSRNHAFLPNTLVSYKKLPNLSNIWIQASVCRVLGKGMSDLIKSKLKPFVNSRSSDRYRFQFLALNRIYLQISVLLPQICFYSHQNDLDIEPFRQLAPHISKVIHMRSYYQASFQLLD